MKNPSALKHLGTHRHLRQITLIASLQCVPRAVTAREHRDTSQRHKALKDMLPSPAPPQRYGVTTIPTAHHQGWDVWVPSDLPRL